MFTISNKADEQTFISLRGLVKNNGFFKSAAQQKFMLKSYGKEQMDTKMLGYLGVTLNGAASTLPLWKMMPVTKSRPGNILVKKVRMWKSRELSKSTTNLRV